MRSRETRGAKFNKKPQRIGNIAQHEIVIIFSLTERLHVSAREAAMISGRRGELLTFVKRCARARCSLTTSSSSSIAIAERFPQSSQPFVSLTPAARAHTVQRTSCLTVTPKGQAVVLLPNLSAARLGVVVTMALVDTTGTLSGSSETTDFAVLLNVD